MNGSRSTTPVTRRANTLVLVTALLVLLVIVATAYLGRTRGERTLAVATAQSHLQGDRAEVIADTLASELAEQLFVRRVPRTIPPLHIVAGAVVNPAANSNVVRDFIQPNAVRHGPDFEPGVVGTYEYNQPPFHTVPWTNWPDGDFRYPRGPANPGGTLGLHDGNIAGNPGYGDNRLLRDLEPLRAVALVGPDGIANTDDDIQTYTHWRHLTNIARPENAFRQCFNIADVGNSLITDLSWPVEQWLPHIVPTSDVGGVVIGSLAGQISPTSGTYLYSNLAPGGGVVQYYPGFGMRWEAWLGDGGSGWGSNHPEYFTQQSLIPPNFYLLSDLNGNGILNEPGERPENVFDGPGTPGFPFGSGRWDVERFLTDTDGDGYTDAFWFLAPTGSERGLRQLVAVSVVDNGGLLNVNTASRFVRSNISPPNNLVDSRLKTIGATPADTALVGQNFITNPAQPYNNWNTGYFDTILNHAFDGLGAPFNFFSSDEFRVQFQPDMWDTWTTGAPARVRNFLGELGVYGNTLFPRQLAAQDERAGYFRAIGTRINDPSGNLRPFTMADELELRMFRGRNNASILSRLERAIDRRVGDIYGGSPTGAAAQQVFLRSDDYREETNGFFNVLSPPALIKDNRSKLTTYNATRNDLMPPWAWPSPHPDAPQLRYQLDTFGVSIFQVVAPPAVGTPDYVNWVNSWQARIRKVDLRDTPTLKPTATVNDQLDPKLSNAYIAERNAVLRDGIERAVVEMYPNPQNPNQYAGKSILGNFTNAAFGAAAGSLDNYRRVRKLCESMANNIMAAADRDDIPITVDRLKPDAGDPYPYEEATDDSQQPGGPIGRARRFPGFERHPFILEAFVAHAYPIFEVPAGYANGGARTVYSTDVGAIQDIGTSVFVVTIANPFDTPLPLRDDPSTTVNEALFTPQFEMMAFGKKIALKDLFLADNTLASLPSCLPPPPPWVWAGLTDLQKQAFLPRTVTLYAVADDFNGVGDWKERWLEFLDIPRTGAADANVLPSAIALDLDNPAAPAIAFPIVSRTAFDTITTNPIIINRIEVGADGAKRIIAVDRVDLEEGGNSFDFRDSVTDMKLEAPEGHPTPPPPGPGAIYPINPGWDIDAANPAVGDGDHWVQWRRASRSFGYGRDASRAAPRYVSADHRVSKPESLGGPPIGGGPSTDGYFANGHVFRATAGPNDWITRKSEYYVQVANQESLANIVRKPTTFNLRYNETYFYDRDQDGNNGNPANFDLDDWFPDTGVYWNTGTFQMLQRNRDFDRIGELSQVWLWGPDLDVTNKSMPKTAATFAEIISGDHPEYPPAVLVALDSSINRLRIGPTDIPGAGNGTDVLDRRDYDGGATPTLTAAARLSDVFTCDDGGLYPDIDGNGLVSKAELDASRYRLANGYSGRPVHGLINLNTATPEVLRPLPHAYRLVDEIDAPIDNPRVRLPEAIVAYREKAGPKEGDTNTFVPGYGDRGETGGFVEEVRAERGIASVGEIELMTLVPNSGSLSANTKKSWSSGFAASAPFADTFYPDGNPQRSTRVSTDTMDRWDPTSLAFVPDYVVGDVEEERMQFTGLSNLVTTRSDTFTVYFKIRTFRQDPVSGAWDATKRENIVDESRYVMVVDRSEVNRPGDRPKVLLLEKIID